MLEERELWIVKSEWYVIEVVHDRLAARRSIRREVNNRNEERKTMSEYEEFETVTLKIECARSRSEAVGRNSARSASTTLQRGRRAYSAASSAGLLRRFSDGKSAEYARRSAFALRGGGHAIPPCGVVQFSARTSECGGEALRLSHQHSSRGEALTKGRRALLCLAIALAQLLAIHSSVTSAQTLTAQSRPLPAISGREFQSPDSRRLEDDEGAHPGMLWVEQGAKLWDAPTGTATKACASCHAKASETMKGVAARYPAVDPATGKLLNLELRINQCRTERQSASALVPESDELLALTAYVAHQSKGVPRNVSVDGPARPFFEQGRAFFGTRQGQLNLACTQCHDDNAGRRLRGDRISQGQSDGWPAYRLEWQKLGSLGRRLRACSLGVRAEVLDHFSPEYLALELYLAWRGEGLSITVPGVRR